MQTRHWSFNAKICCYGKDFVSTANNVSLEFRAKQWKQYYAVTFVLQGLRLVRTHKIYCYIHEYICSIHCYRSITRRRNSHICSRSRKTKSNSSMVIKLCILGNIPARNSWLMKKRKQQSKTGCLREKLMTRVSFFWSWTGQVGDWTWRTNHYSLFYLAIS